MIKVVHLITQLELGGAQQNTLYTVSHLDSGRFDAALASGTGGLLDDEARRLSDDARRPFLLRFFPELVRPVDPLSDLRAILQLAVFFREQAPDIVHTHSSKAGVLGRLAAWMAGVPAIVHTYHGFGFHDRQPPALRALFVALERLCCLVTTRLVFVSEENRRAALRRGLVGANQGALIRSGVRLSELPARIGDKGRVKASLGCGMHKPLVVSVGNLKPQKNPEAFLRVAELCLKRIPEARFLFAGDGELRNRVEAQVVARGLHGKVLFPGWRRDAREILAAADAFVLTSLWEGLPRALVEAMKSGLPCVCYAVDGVREIIKDGGNGFLVEPGDEEAMAGRVAALLQDPALARTVGERAAASIGPEFDIDRMVRRQEALYEELVSDRGT